MYVADREADMLPLMKRAHDLGNPVDWLVRAAHDRSLPEGEKLQAHTTSKDNDCLGDCTAGFIATVQRLPCALSLPFPRQHR